MIEVLNLTKKIKKTTVLDNISYTFEKGTIYGLFGSNGSGKTMLLRALSGLIVPTEGSITIKGEQLHKDISFPKSVGLIIENMQLLPQYDAFTNQFHRNTITDSDYNCFQHFDKLMRRRRYLFK